MSILTMNNNAFVYHDDNTAPDYHYYMENREHLKNQIQEEPSHYRMTFVTTSPPGALESLLTQLGSRWVPTRQPSTTSRTSTSSPGNHLTIEGTIFSIGTDWLVRAGNVILTGGTVKGMLLEVRNLDLIIQSVRKLTSVISGGISSSPKNVLGAWYYANFPFQYADIYSS